MNKGQISMSVMISIGVSLLIAIVGGWIEQTNITDMKINEVTKENVSTISNVAALKEAVETLKMDNVEIKRDIKELLIRTPKR